MHQMPNTRKALGILVYLVLCALCFRQSAQSIDGVLTTGWFLRDSGLVGTWALGLAASFWVSWRLRRRLGRQGARSSDGGAVSSDLSWRGHPSGGLTPLERVLFAALAVYALSTVAQSPRYYFVSWPIPGEFTSAGLKAVQLWFMALSWAAVPLFTLWDPRRWLPKALAAGLLATQIVCCYALLRHTNLTAPYSDDHPSFLFRITEFLGAFPWRENYVPHWNAGVVNSVITSSGVSGYAILGAPLWLLLPPHLASPYALLLAFAFFVPWMTYAGFRATGLSKTGALLGAVFALAQGPLFMLWIDRKSVV